LLPTLWLAQREFGWLSQPVQAYVAELMEIPVSWVSSVVSFYTMYWTEPKGRHHLQVCVNLSCALRGSDSSCAP
jgi:NADH-quinone oxidoreductase subunit E